MKGISIVFEKKNSLKHNHNLLDLAILKLLIDHNADVDCLDKQKRTPFIWAASTSKNLLSAF